MKYTKQIVDKELEERLETFGATLIIGPKRCGKTTTGLQKAKSVFSTKPIIKHQPKLADAFSITYSALS